MADRERRPVVRVWLLACTFRKYKWYEYEYKYDMNDNEGEHKYEKMNGMLRLEAVAANILTKEPSQTSRTQGKCEICFYFYDISILISIHTTAFISNPRAHSHPSLNPPPIPHAVST